MAWNFLKKLIKKEEQGKPHAHAAAEPAARQEAAPRPPAPLPAAAAKPAAPVREKSPAEKTDDELAAELDKMSPQILAQARDPQMRALIIGIYRKMLLDNVNINDDTEVKKWMKKHPEVLQGGEAVKVETVRREEPKVGRNDPCTCGSGKKFKKCCGEGRR